MSKVGLETGYTNGRHWKECNRNLKNLASATCSNISSQYTNMMIGQKQLMYRLVMTKIIACFYLL